MVVLLMLGGLAAMAAVTGLVMCTRYQDGYGCLRVWHSSGRFFQWELHRRWAA